MITIAAAAEVQQASKKNTENNMAAPYARHAHIFHLHRDCVLPRATAVGFEGASNGDSVIDTGVVHIPRIPDDAVASMHAAHARQASC